MVQDDARPVVAVWRSHWLPPSETFVRDHVLSLRRWRPVKIGLHDDPNELGERADWAPFPRSGPLRHLEAISARAGHRGVYTPVLRRSGARLVHAHFGPDALAVLPIARRLGLPLIVTFHGYDVTTRVHQDISGDYRRALAELFAYATVLLPVSEFLGERLRALGAPESKLHVHYLGIPISGNRPSPNAPREGVLFVGRLVEKKGVDDLIAAYSMLPPGLRRVNPLSIVGEGPLGEELVALARPVVDDVHFYGWQDPESVASMMAAARVFCGPSKIAKSGDAEGFGLVFLEAAGAGAPVVAYSSAGVPEAVPDGVTGLLATEGDVSGLSQRLLQLLSDTPQAEGLGAAGQARVIRDFDILHRTELLEELYDDVVRPGGRKPRKAND